MTEEEREQIEEELAWGESRGIACRIFREVPVEPDVFCRFAAVTQDGAFLILCAGDPDAMEAVLPALHLPSHTCLWPEEDGGTSFLDREEEKLLPVRDVVTSFRNVYFLVNSGQGLREDAALRKAAVREDRMEVPEIIPHPPALGRERYEVICALFQRRLDGDLEKERARTGRHYREREGIPCLCRRDVLGREHWYPISQTEDPERLFRCCALGGFVGAHKFAEHRYLQGVLYAATLGLGGVLWISDLFSMAFGTYLLKDGSYLGKLQRTRDAVFSALLGLLVGGAVLFAARLGLQAAFAGITGAFSEREAALLLGAAVPGELK